MKEIFEEVAKECGVPVSTVEAAVKSFYHYIKKKMSHKRYRDLDSFENVKTNISIPGLGKLVVSHKIKENYEERKQNSKGKMSV